MSLFVIVTLLLCLNCHEIEGKRKISREYDCVDMYKQPAFNHVLLKNHKIQMAPSFLPKLRKNGRSQPNIHSNFQAHDGGCPAGKVPILRPRVKDPTADIHPLTGSEPGHHFATFKSTLNTRTFGASAAIGLDNPPVKMNQISAATIWIENGDGAQLNSLQVGWAVHPRIYGDNFTRLTGYWTADASRKTGCYNLVCPGFVQVNSRFYLGQYYPTPPPNERLIMRISVRRDKQTGNWWLLTRNNTIQVGYWPSKIFTQFGNGALSLKFGGWTYNSPDGVSPPMGNGHFPTTSIMDSGFFSNLKYQNNVGQMIDIYRPQKFTDNTGCYDAVYWGKPAYDPDLEETFTYGGPGGNCGI